MYLVGRRIARPRYATPRIVSGLWRSIASKVFDFRVFSQRAACATVLQITKLWHKIGA